MKKILVAHDGGDPTRRARRFRWPRPSGRGAGAARARRWAATAAPLIRAARAWYGTAGSAQLPRRRA